MERDDRWFEELYRQHRSAIHAYCARRVGIDAAPDAVADVFSVVWRRRGDVPVTDGALPWLYGVARNVVSHQWRGTRRRRRLVARAGSVPPIATVAGPEVQVELGEEHRAVRAAVDQLGSLDREVLLLKAWEGLDHEQIARVLDCSRSAVDKRVTRAKARLAARYLALSDSGARAERTGRRDPEVLQVRGRRGGDRT
jgi:RNA polymerase sigma factor (sigma-70 family)